jgi:hypothetical protein
MDSGQAASVQQRMGGMGNGRLEVSGKTAAKIADAAAVLPLGSRKLRGLTSRRLCSRFDPFFRQIEFETQAGMYRQPADASKTDSGPDQSFYKKRRTQDCTGGGFLQAVRPVQTGKTAPGTGDKLSDRQMSGTDLLTGAAEQAAGKHILKNR